MRVGFFRSDRGRCARSAGWFCLAHAAVLAVALPLPALAAAADQVKLRVSGYRALGAAYKTVTDSLRSNDLRLPEVRIAARRISDAAQMQYRWFPAGSGPRPGVKTAAKTEIWHKSADFRAAQDAFARQARAFNLATTGGDASAIRSEARKLGGACKSCHDAFRVPTD